MLPLERPTTTNTTVTPVTMTKYNDSFRPNCATYIMKHVSSDDDIDDESRHSYNNTVVEDNNVGSDVERMEQTLVYDENFNSEPSDNDAAVVDAGDGDEVRRNNSQYQHHHLGSNSAKYFKITYTKEEIHSLG
jgi:hypothetical protein